MTRRRVSLTQLVESNEAIISTVKDRVAMWILGYVATYGLTLRSELYDSLKTSDPESAESSLQRLIEVEFVREQDGSIIASEMGMQFAHMVGVPRHPPRGRTRIQVSCDVLTVENVRLLDAPEPKKQAIIDGLIKSPRLYMFGSEGARYGFVECGVLGEKTLFGNFTQEYLAHYLRYDEHLQRQEEWDTRNYNVLFILPLNSQILVLQDAKFYGAATLSMSTTMARMQMALQMLFDHHGIERTGDLVLKPYHRVLSKEEMIKALVTTEESVTEAYLELSGDGHLLQDKLSVFNPREEWNEALTAIINEYELPNVARAKFSSTKTGTLGKSALVKALALAGEIKRMKLGHGKKSRVVKRAVPTHVGRVVVSDPPTEEDIAGVLRFLQDQLELDFGSLPLKVSDAVWQMRFEI